MKLHVLIGGIDPFRIYIHEDGFVYFTKEEYQLYLLLLNLKQNIYIPDPKKEKYTIVNDYNLTDISKGHIWNIELFKTYLNNSSYDVEGIFSNITNLIIKTFITYMVPEREFYKENEYSDKDRIDFKNFMLFGCDIEFDSKMIPYIVKINKMPISKKSRLSQVSVIKEQIVRDQLNLIGLRNWNRNLTDDPYPDLVDEALCETIRPIGGFVRAFPRKENIEYFRQFFNYTKSDLKFWIEIEGGDYDRIAKLKDFVSNNKNFD